MAVTLLGGSEISSEKIREAALNFNFKTLETAFNKSPEQSQLIPKNK